MCSKGSQGPKLSSCGHRRFRSEWADAQADHSLRWANMSLVFVVHGGGGGGLKINRPLSFSLQERVVVLAGSCDYSDYAYLSSIQYTYKGNESTV